GHVAGYEPVSRRLLVYGGTTGDVASNLNFVFGDAWLLTEEPGGPAWTRLAPGGGVPRPRFDAAVAYASASNRLVVVSGANNKVGDPGDIWVLSDAVGSLALVSANQPQTSYTAGGLVPGETYYWKVVTRDSAGAWRGSPVFAFTSNAPPVVSAGPDPNVALPASAALARSGPDAGPPQGQPLEVAWSVVNGPGPVTFADASSPSTTAAFVAAGVYTLRLTASDGSLAASDDTTVVVDAPNQPPIVSAGADPALALPEPTTTLV